MQAVLQESINDVSRAKKFVLALTSFESLDRPSKEFFKPTTKINTYYSAHNVTIKCNALI